MKFKSIVLSSLVLFICVQTMAQKKKWTSLFDGKTTTGWHTYGETTAGQAWKAEDGVLFLDELPEYKRIVLEVMRQPLEERKVTISRAKIAVEFPASFMLLASMNPCPCGFFNHPEKPCSCPPGAVLKYLNKNIRKDEIYISSFLILCI